MTEKELKIYEVKVRPELQAFGLDLTTEDIQIILNELGDSVRVGKQIFELTNEEKVKIYKHALADLSREETEHVYVKGGGFYKNDEETVLNKEDWSYYKKHRNFISDHIFNGQLNVVKSIDFETDQIIKKIPNPTKEGNSTFLNKGLVVGYVQSGKTANFTHLIAKAASIGYKFIVVLGGMTNTLRSQTQYRIDRELTGNNQYGQTDVSFVSWAKEERKYDTLTRGPSIDYPDDGDFRIPQVNFSDHFANTNNTTIAVIKKLAREGDKYNRFKSVLGRLILWVEKRNDPTADLPALMIIDDEADQASIDSNDDDIEPTTINHAIRYFISLFNQVSYVGYTATPFANVFIDSNSFYNGLPDLYPDDFIYSLPEPKRYFGTKQFFGTEWREGDRANLIFINNVPDNERNDINDSNNEITESVVQALWDFIFAVIIRRFRGDKKHCGFMLHTDHRNIFHDIVKIKVERYIDEVKDSLDFQDQEIKSFIFKEWKRYIKKSEQISLTKNYKYDMPDFDVESLSLRSSDILNEVRIRVINGLNDNLDYQAEDLSTLICIGGNIMSRGVTIEGLTISYYLRESPKYDTLLQMGRWFGYRAGYEDLVRVYTTSTIEEYFEYIMGVEDDLRSEISRYQEENLTPREFAPRVRAHLRMTPSAKMGAATMQRSYSRQSEQTIYLLQDIKTLKNNNLAVESLIEKTYKGEERSSEGNYDIKNIPIHHLLQFLRDYITPNHEIAGFDKEDILRYLNVRNNSGEISNFDLRIAGRASIRDGSFVDDLPHGMLIYPVKRNARSGSGWKKINNGIVNVGVISDSNDMPDYKNGSIERPLLIIYSIDRINSNSFKQGDFTEEGDFIPGNSIIDGLDFNPKGFALAFPSSDTAEGERDYYQQIINV